MASIDSSLISDPREQKWVAEISEILKHQLEINVETPPVSIFQIPETITTKNPEAYKPQQIGFGPYHHFQPGPYTKTEQKKLMVVQRVVQYHKIEDFRLTVLDKVEKLVPVIRACYERFLQDDNVSLAWVFAIDGLFLLNIFKTYNDGEHPEVDATKRLLAQDIMMVENQLPFMVLMEIDRALHPSSGNTIAPSIFRSFCEIHSPLKLCEPSDAPDEVEHLLHYMYYSIIYISKRRIGGIPSSKVLPPSSSPFGITDSITHASDFLKNVPHIAIADIYNQTIITLQNFSRNKIAIPSASKLHGRAGFKFYVEPYWLGVNNIYMNEKEIALPCVTLNNDSDVIFRNLVAYETLMPTLMPKSDDRFPVTEYLGLMCGLIVDVEDVKLLKKENIIKGNLLDDEVVKIFVEMSSSILSLKTKKKSSLQEKIDVVNKVYERRPMIKAYLFTKKLANWLLVGLTAIGSFVGATWKIVAFMVSIVAVFMLTYQAYCDVYGCEKANVTLLSHASS